MRVLATLSILASSLLFTHSASAVENPYSESTGNGDVSCLSSYVGTSGPYTLETGYFTIENNVVTGQTECAGTATIPSGVTAIGTSNNGFMNAQGLTSVIISNTVTSIGAWAFYNTGITTISIPNSVESIGRGAFYQLSSLTSLSLGNGLTSIGSIAFQGTRLSSLTIPNSVTTLGEGAFSTISTFSSYQYCGSTLTSRDLALAGLVLVAGSFSQSNSCAPTIGTLYNINTRSGDVACTTGFFTVVNNAVTKYQDCVGAVSIPSGVTSIGANAFEWATGITSVVIPNSVTTIGVSAFQRAWGITSLTLGTGISRIPNRAFYMAQGLTSLTIPNSVTSIGSEAFYYADHLTSLTIGNRVTSIEDRAFSDVIALTSLSIPNSVISIGYSAFNGGSSLTSLTIGNSVQIIGAYAFGRAGAITTLTIPNSVISIGNGAFNYYNSLTSLTLGNSITTISDDAFTGAGSLTSLIIPRSVTSIGARAYNGANSLNSYEYCGRSLTTSDFVNAGLGESQTNTCTPTVTAPNAPTSIVATSTGATTASVAFTAPTDDGGSAITSYTAISTPGFITAVITQAESGTISVTGLTPRTAYTFRVVATNSIGDSYPSSPSNSVPEVTIAPRATITAGDTTNSQVATFSSGVTEAEIPATNELPAIKLNFGGTAPTAVTVAPLEANPAPASATPFRVTGSTKIVDIQVTGSFNGSATVCLDGTSTDSVFHFTGGAWVELANRTYANGQVCGETTSFSPFTAALANISPNAPATVVATATGKRSATVSFTAPDSDGGSVVTSYTATSNPATVTKTLTQADGGTFTFDNLQPATSYTFEVTATNAIGTSSATTSNSITTAALVPASISAITFTDDGTGTAGKLTWVGSSIDAVLYTGPANSYPGPFTFGAFTTGWKGTIRNLNPDTNYTISIFAISADGIGESKSLTFKTGPKKELLKDLAYWGTWLSANTATWSESSGLLRLLNKFNLLEPSRHRSYIKVPTSRVLTVSAKSLTPDACSVVSPTAKVDAGLVTAHTQDTCTISYTVSGRSKAPATLVKDFIFKKAAK
ncbi:unannotated protein [freshwater metagenome]|uniref:Unannotated protein n=1 Tax=freshwater metagenome TaxID=449393 RepID=A0A6J6GSB0_9ZZZZ